MIPNNSGYSWHPSIKVQELDTFLKQFKIVPEITTEKILYLEDKTVSQSKIRDAGFTIVRNKDKADLIVIKDIFKDLNITSNGNHYEAKTYLYYNINDKLQFLEDNPNYTYVYDSVLYKKLYKYEGNLELFKTLNELFNSNDTNNSKLAMEMMCNANWENNEIYLQELFSMHRYNFNSEYKNSISFKGFLNTLDFNYKTIRLYHADDYKDLCKTEEHHQYVFDKYTEGFKHDLDNLLERYKLELIDIKYKYKT